MPNTFQTKNPGTITLQDKDGFEITKVQWSRLKHYVNKINNSSPWPDRFLGLFSGLFTSSAIAIISSLLSNKGPIENILNNTFYGLIVLAFLSFGGASACIAYCSKSDSSSKGAVSSLKDEMTLLDSCFETSYKVNDWVEFLKSDYEKTFPNRQQAQAFTATTDEEK